MIEAIWPAGSPPGTSVWAILDCARDSSDLLRLEKFPARLPLPVPRPVAPRIGARAPYLVEVAPTYTFTPKLIEMGWGQSWGVFLRIKDSLNLRHHLRGFLRVQDESGKILIFRYYRSARAAGSSPDVPARRTADGLRPRRQLPDRGGRWQELDRVRVRREPIAGAAN